MPQRGVRAIPASEDLKYKTANTEGGARLDIKANDFWGSDQQCAFFDVRILIKLPEFKKAVEGMTKMMDEEEMRCKVHRQS